MCTVAEDPGCVMLHQSQCAWTAGQEICTTKLCLLQEVVEAALKLGMIALGQPQLAAAAADLILATAAAVQATPNSVPQGLPIFEAAATRLVDMLASATTPAVAPLPQNKSCHFATLLLTSVQKTTTCTSLLVNCRCSVPIIGDFEVLSIPGKLVVQPMSCLSGRGHFGGGGFAMLADRQILNGSTAWSRQEAAWAAQRHTISACSQGFRPSQVVSSRALSGRSAAGAIADRLPYGALFPWLPATLTVWQILTQHAPHAFVWQESFLVCIVLQSLPSH